MAKVNFLDAGKIEDILSAGCGVIATFRPSDGGEAVPAEVQTAHIPQTVSGADHRGEAQLRHRAQPRRGQVQTHEVRHRAEDAALREHRAVLAEVEVGEVGKTLKGAAGEGEAAAGGGPDGEAVEACEAEESFVGHSLEVAVHQLQLLQPDEAAEAARLEAGDGGGVGAADGEAGRVVRGDHAEVGPLLVAVDGGQVAHQLEAALPAAAAPVLARPRRGHAVPGHGRRLGGGDHRGQGGRQQQHRGHGLGGHGEASWRSHPHCAGDLSPGPGTCSGRAPAHHPRPETRKQ